MIPGLRRSLFLFYCVTAVPESGCSQIGSTPLYAVSEVFIEKINFFHISSPLFVDFVMVVDWRWWCAWYWAGVQDAAVVGRNCRTLTDRRYSLNIAVPESQRQVRQTQAGHMTAAFTWTQMSFPSFVVFWYVIQHCLLKLSVCP